MKEIATIFGFFALFGVAALVLTASKEAQRKGKESTDITWTEQINVGSVSYIDITDERRGISAAVPGFKIFNPYNDTVSITAQARENTDTQTFVLYPGWSPIVFKAVFSSSGDSLFLIGK